METESEWTYLKELIQNLEDSGHMEYYIGLSKASGKWRWLSNNETVPEEKWRWQFNPSGDGKCTVMYKNYHEKKGYFNDLSCYSVGSKKIKRGFICEKDSGKFKNHYSYYIYIRILMMKRMDASHLSGPNLLLWPTYNIQANDQTKKPRLVSQLSSGQSNKKSQISSS